MHAVQAAVAEATSDSAAESHGAAESVCQSNSWAAC